MTTIPTPIPFSAAYPGATAADFEAAKAQAGDAYIPSAFDPKTRVRGGHARIARDRVTAEQSDGQPGFNMFYEVHGTGPRHIAFIMGLNNTCHGWLGQVTEFGRDERYSVLVFDNRGYSNSASPKQRYTTTMMADDMLELLDVIGWTEPRSVYLMGVSMGGMIALELCNRHPERIAGVLLQSTTPGDMTNLPGVSATMTFTRLFSGAVFGTSEPEDRALTMIRLMFPKEWLEQPDEDDPERRTHEQVIYHAFSWRISFLPRPVLTGALSQLAAVLTHRVRAKDLAKIDANIPQIKILTGDKDAIVSPRHSYRMKSLMPHAELHVWEGGGHAVHAQFPRRYNGFLHDWLD